MLTQRIEHADYERRRGHRCRIAPIDPPGEIPFGARIVGVSPLRSAAGFEQFSVSFAIPEAPPEQKLYRIVLDGLPEHALVLVPHASEDRSVVFDADFNRSAAS